MNRKHVTLIRVVAACSRKDLQLPKSEDYPLPPEARTLLFDLTQKAHIIRMDAREMSPREEEAMRKHGWPDPVPAGIDWDMLTFWGLYLFLSSAGFFAGGALFGGVLCRV